MQATYIAIMSSREELLTQLRDDTSCSDSISESEDGDLLPRMDPEAFWGELEAEASDTGEAISSSGDEELPPIRNWQIISSDATDSSSSLSSSDSDGTTDARLSQLERKRQLSHSSSEGSNKLL